MPDDTGVSALLSASDVSMVKRLAQLQEQQAAIEAAQEELRVATEHNQKILTEIQAERRGVAEAKAKVDAGEAALAERTATLTAMLKSHGEERTRWEEQRKIVDAQHASATAKHAQAEDRHAALALAIREKGAELVRREHAVELREATFVRRQQAIEAAYKVQ